MSDIEVLMMDGCTKSEAENHLKKGTTVFSDFKQNFDAYMAEWGINEEEQAEYKAMIEQKKPVLDWGIVEDSKKTYYIQYVL